MPISTRRQRAETLRPDFDWRSYDQASARQVAISKSRLGANRHERRVGIPETPVIELRTNEEKMTDQAIVKQGDALMKTAWNDLEEVKQAVYAAYKGGNAALDNAEMKAVALIAFNLQLDPSPGVGHLYAWKDKDKDGNLRFTVTVGYQGYVHKANQQYSFVHHCRPMTTTERQEHGLKDGEIGAICELYEVGRIQMWRDMGLEPKPIKGTAVWRPEYNSEIKARSDKVPQGRSPLWVAEKNALKDAIRQLGIGFGSMVIPTIDGLEYDRESDGWSMPVVESPERESPTPPAKSEEPVEAEFTADKAEEVPGGGFPFEAAAPVATNTAESAKPERPWTPTEVFAELKEKANRSQSAASKRIVTEGETSALISRMKEWASADICKFILKQAFDADSSRELESREKAAIMSWLPSRSVLTHAPDTVKWIEAEIAAIEAAMKPDTDPAAVDTASENEESSDAAPELGMAA